MTRSIQVRDSQTIGTDTSSDSECYRETIQASQRCVAQARVGKRYRNHDGVYKFGVSMIIESDGDGC